MEKFTNNKIDFTSLQLKFFAYQNRLKKQINKFNHAMGYFKNTHRFYMVSSIIAAVVLVAISILSSQFSVPKNEFLIYVLFGSIFPLMDLCGFTNYKYQQIKCNLLNNKINKMNLDMYNQIMASQNYNFNSPTPEVRHTIDPRLSVDPRLAVSQKKKTMVSPIHNTQFAEYKKSVAQIKDDEKER